VQAAKLPPLVHLTSTDKIEYVFDLDGVSAVYAAIPPHERGQPPVFPPQAGQPKTAVWGVVNQPVVIDETAKAFLDEFKITGQFLQFTGAASPEFPLYIKTRYISVILPASYFRAQYDPKVKTLIYAGASDPWQVFEDPATVEGMVNNARSQPDSP
jgi:hypothetical protein